jgi:hypothetical protein
MFIRKAKGDERREAANVNVAAYVRFRLANKA